MLFFSVNLYGLTSIPLNHESGFPASAGVSNPSPLSSYGRSAYKLWVTRALFAPFLFDGNTLDRIICDVIIMSYLLSATNGSCSVCML